MRTYPLPASGEVIIANTAFKVDAPVISYRQAPFWDASREVCYRTETHPSPPCNGGVFPFSNKLPKPYTRRYAIRPMLRAYGSKPPPLAAAQAAITQFVVHHDGCTSADMCWSVLQNERGLSCHFLVDNNGVIFQTIDLALMAYHAAEFNIRSIGVEFCNRGDAKKYPDTYENGKHGGGRDKVYCQINGYKYYAFTYTKAQLQSFGQLARELRRILPNLPIEYPQSSPGEQAWLTLPRQAAFSFRGYIGHYHLTGQKWDPGPFDFKEFCRSLRGQFSLPMYASPSAADPRDKPPAIPENIDEFDAACLKLFQANERRADGGFFPVGPWGEHRLWHGGVHLVAPLGSPLYAQFPGRLVAARMGPRSPVGSVNFVLLRHDMTLGDKTVRFYALYMHLLDEQSESPPVVPWLESKGWQEWKAKGRAGEVALLDEPIDAGTLIGRVGMAGPPEIAKAQVHLEIFSGPNDRVFDSQGWTYLDGSAGGRFCDVDAINDEIDSNHDHRLTREELSSYYGGGAGRAKDLRVVLHVSEWTAEPNWVEALRSTADFHDVKLADVEALVAEQLAPGLWWDDRVARHARLPSDGVVYHYHPIAFLRFFNKRILENVNTPPPDPTAGKDAPDTITDDFHDEAGTSMRSDLEDATDPCDESLTLEDLVRGFESPECVD
ncbi:MAG: N-acetylmuramoyl-L-alanine amidase [Kofleriaceae bacterium]